MSLPITTHRRADTISTAVLLIALAILMYTNAWWPWILLGIGAVVVTRQYFLVRFYDMLVTSLIFIGLFCFFYFPIKWSVILPVLFTVAAIYIIFREYLFSNNDVGINKVENESLEVSEEEKEDEK